MAPIFPRARSHMAWVRLAGYLGLLLVVACDRAASVPAEAARADARAGGTPAPHDSLIPEGPLGVSIRRGRAILAATRDSLPEHVGNKLRCTSCHFDDGTRANVMPWMGVYGQFPQYRARAGGVQIIEDRINDCFERSMNGKALPHDSPALRDMIAYLAFLSLGIPSGAQVDGQGLPPLKPLQGDTVRGAAIYASTCARCHGANGEGGAAPPAWGPESYNIGAGMARVRTAAAFVRAAMPYDTPGILTDQEAFDVATYVNTRPRPDLPGKELDWPKGDPPPDVAYETRAAAKKRQ
ncbi:MAG: c-type cytochrome [Gemmatimonadaceae bacterium]